jgi:hypothetical protein
LGPSKSARWLEVRTMTAALIQSHRLPDGIDITREFVEAILRHIDDGWRVPEFSSRAAVFKAVRGTEARMIHVVLAEPGTAPGFGAAHLVSSPGHDD